MTAGKIPGADGNWEQPRRDWANVRGRMTTGRMPLRGVRRRRAMDEVRGEWLRRIQVILAVLFALGVAGQWGLAALRSPDVAFLPPGPTPWIGAPILPVTKPIWVDPARPMATTFERHFTVDKQVGRVVLQVRAMRDVVLQLNGSLVPLAGRDARRWKEPSVVDVTPLIVMGENLLHVEVRNPEGIPFLQLSLGGLAEPLLTDERWLATWEDEPPRPAAIADDGVRIGDSTSLPSPLSAVREHALALVTLAGAGMISAAILQGRRSVAEKGPAVALAIVALFWAWLFAAKIVHLAAAGLGFDGPAHLFYIKWLLQHRTLPLATAGSETYHPPLYHVLTALLVAALRPAPGIAERALLSLLPVLSGLGMAFVAAAMARCLAPDAPWMRAGSAIAAGLLPSSLTLAASVSNELPHALLASLAMLATVRSLLKERTTPFDDIVLGLFLAGGLLTKYTSVILVPTFVGAVAAKRILSESAPSSQVALGAARTLAVVAVLAGWVYVRNWILFGNPLVSNFSDRQGNTLWQYPGFHTASYFLQFGDAFTQPWFSGFHSFWDSVYTTFWGDGMLGGVSRVRYAHGGWRYDWMAAVFVLALPATFFLVAGWIRAMIGALRDDNLGRRLALSLIVGLPPLLLAALMSFNLQHPFWSSGKAFYALFLTPTFAYLMVSGFEALDRMLAGRAPLAVRMLPWGWASAFFGSIALAYGG